MLTISDLNQDLVRAEGRVVSVGRSSMVVNVRAYRQDLLSRQFELVQVRGAPRVHAR
jgi:acyl-CoA hydrolase